MEIKDGELIFERAFDIEALYSFNCGIRELDLLIHKKIMDCVTSSSITSVIPFSFTIMKFSSHCLCIAMGRS